MSVTLGLGAQSAPAYFGAKEQALGPTGSFALNRLSFGPLSVDGGARTGFGVHGGFRYIAPRSAADYAALTGLNDVPAAVELGGGIDYATDDYRLYADVRYGVVGHESFVAEMGGDVYYRPSDALTFSAGPRIFFGDDSYAETYFGVTPTESLASGGALTAFDAQGGLLSTGVEGAVTYQVTDSWGVTGSVSYDQLRADAAASPISGTDDQFSASIMVTRTVTFGF